MTTIEPLLVPSEDRFVLFPIKYPRAHEFWVQSQALVWSANEIMLDRDLEDWSKMNEGMKRLVLHVLAFFAASDGIVNENINVNFSREIHDAAIRMVYTAQAFIESVHSETYSLLIATYVSDPAEQTHLFNAVRTMPCVAKKAAWALKYQNDQLPFSHRIIAFAAVEGLFFSGSFASIFFIKKQGLLPGLTQSNSYIARDEGLHTEFACWIYSQLVNRVSQKEVHALIRDAVAIEHEFVRDAMPVELIGMNSSEMCTYIEFVADRLLQSLGYEKVWNAVNPFDWMVAISLDTKVNFFDRVNTNYAKTVTKRTEFKITDDF